MSSVIDCGPAAALQPGAMRRVEVPGRAPLALYNIDGEYLATDDNCTHKWASLASGWLEGDKVVCPWHGGAYDVRSGRAVAPPCVTPLQTWPVAEQGGRLLVTLDSAAADTAPG